MNGPFFSHEGLKPERHSRQQNANSYVVKFEEGTDEKGVKSSQCEKRLGNCQLFNRHHDLDE